MSIQRCEITALAHGGHGIGRIDGQVCFVTNALPGDVVDVDITKRARGIVWGVVKNVMTPSPHRTHATCPVFGVCGGCTWLHFAYPAQAEWKRRIVSDCLKRIAHIETDLGWVEDPVLRLGYRTRAEFHGSSGRWGFYERESHRIANITSCPLCQPNLNAAFEKLRAIRFDGEVELVVNPEGDDVLAWCKHPSPAIREMFHACDALDSTDRARFHFDGVPIVNGAFSQSSLLLNRLLLRELKRMVGSPTSLLDLYCGNGNLSLWLAGQAEVAGFDVNAVAVAAANAVSPGTYTAAPESHFPTAIASRPWDVIVLDPPRTGAKTITPALVDARANTLIYVACDPAALARDLQTLTQGGWQIAETVCLDLFPNTAHVETLCRLFR